MEKELEKTCNCSDSCDCGCNEGESCTFEDCHCTEEHNCGCMDEDCTCDDECCCNEGCDSEVECHCGGICDREHECSCDDCACDDNCHCHDSKTETEIEVLENRVKELETKALASQAEMINYRRRKDEEVTRMLKYANEDIVTELLQTIDNFERAIKMDDRNLEDEVSKFLEGFKMIYCNLVNTLEKFEVKAIDGNNKEFDPTYHQAVMTEKVEGMAPGMVIEVLQKGYLLKDKVIRPAMVKVSE